MEKKELKLKQSSTESEEKETNLSVYLKVGISIWTIYRPTYNYGCRVRWFL